MTTLRKHFFNFVEEIYARPISSCKIFSMVHLLHRLYGVDAPAIRCLLFRPLAGNRSDTVAAAKLFPRREIDFRRTLRRHWLCWKRHIFTNCGQPRSSRISKDICFHRNYKTRPKNTFASITSFAVAWHSGMALSHITEFFVTKLVVFLLKCGRPMQA